MRVQSFADRRPYFAMKLVKGQTLAKLLEERPDPSADLPRFLSIFEEVATTLRAASDSITSIADLDVTSPEMVRYLGEWVGAPALDKRLAIQKQRDIVHATGATIGQTWRDKEHEKFVEEFEQTLLVMKRFVEATNQHVPFLLRKAERIEEYLQQR